MSDNTSSDLNDDASGGSLSDEDSNDDVPVVVSAETSGAASEIEKEPEVGDAVEGSEGEGNLDVENLCRTKPATFTLWKNGYYTCTRDPKYFDVKIRLLERRTTE